MLLRCLKWEVALLAVALSALSISCDDEPEVVEVTREVIVREVVVISTSIPDPTATTVPALEPTQPPAPTAATATPMTATPTATLTATTTPDPTMTPAEILGTTPTRTAIATPTPIPGRSDLYRSVYPPEHMAYIWWEWERQRDSSGERLNEFEELVINFTVHNDVELRDGNGLYLQLAHSRISDIGFYFGIQTDMLATARPYSRGKGLIFSRWETRDLANARIPEEGWTESSGHEGNFIGVRRSYAWGAGDYRVRMAPDGPPDDDGVWFGLWITELGLGTTTWIGSLKFPLLDGRAVMRAPSYSTMEIYGGMTRPIDIPEWHVSIERPMGDGVQSTWGHTGYSPIEGEIMNSEVRYDRDADIVHLMAGGTTERRTLESAVTFRPGR